VIIERFRGELVLIDSNRGEDSGAGYGGDSAGFRSAPASRPAAARAPAGAGGPSWEPAGGGDLDDEIPF
jgi:single-strand DNA-binding protein